MEGFQIIATLLLVGVWIASYGLKVYYKTQISAMKSGASKILYYLGLSVLLSLFSLPIVIGISVVGVFVVYQIFSMSFMEELFLTPNIISTLLAVSALLNFLTVAKSSGNVHGQVQGHKHKVDKEKRKMEFTQAKASRQVMSKKASVAKMRMNKDLGKETVSAIGTTATQVFKEAGNMGAALAEIPVKITSAAFLSTAKEYKLDKAKIEMYQGAIEAGNYKVLEENLDEDQYDHFINEVKLLEG